MPNTAKSHGLYSHAYPASSRDKYQRPRTTAYASPSQPSMARSTMTPVASSLTPMSSYVHLHGVSPPPAFGTSSQYQREQYGRRSMATASPLAHYHQQQQVQQQQQHPSMHTNSRHGYSSSRSINSSRGAMDSEYEKLQPHTQPNTGASAAWRGEIDHSTTVSRGAGVKRPAPSSSFRPHPSHSYGAERNSAVRNFSSCAQTHHRTQVPAVPLPALSCFLQRNSDISRSAAAAMVTEQNPLRKRQRMFASPPSRENLAGADTERLHRILDAEVALYNQRNRQECGDTIPRSRDRVVADAPFAKEDEEFQRPVYTPKPPRAFIASTYPRSDSSLDRSESSSSNHPSSSSTVFPKSTTSAHTISPDMPMKYATASTSSPQREHRDRDRETPHRKLVAQPDLSSRSPPPRQRATRYASETQRYDDGGDADASGAEDYGSNAPGASLRYSASSPSDSAIEAASGLLEERSPSKRESITKLLLKSKEFLKAKSLVRNRNNEIDWVATFLNVGFESSSIYSLMCPLRKGRWKVEEEKYTMELLRLIESGTIRLRHGQSIRGFIAKKLHSDDMRVLKKLSNCKVFHFAREITPQMSDEDEIDEDTSGAVAALDRLGKLRSEFLRSVQLEALVAVRKYLSDSSIRELLNGRD